MKKKKILLGLALAAAAVFSLASCGDDDNTPADSGQSQVTPDNGGSQGGNNSQGGNQGGNTQTQKYSVTYHTAHGTAPAAVANVTALPATLPTLEDEEYDFLGWTATENGTELVTAGAAITKNTDLYAVWAEKDKYTVTYHTAHGTAPDNLANIRKLPDTLPTLTDVDYNFVGWTATENGTELVTAGSAISANTDLYAVWAEKVMYDKVVARGTANQTLKINETFSETSSIDVIDDFEDAIEAKLYQKVSTKGSPKAGSAYSMTVENGVAKANDNDVTIQKDDGTNNGKILNIISFGQAAKTVEGYYDVELPVAAGSWTFFIINGSDTAKTSGEIFGLRTVKVTENNTDKIYLKYRVDGGSETNPETTIELTNNIKIGVHYVINVETQKVTIEIVTFGANNTQTVNKFVTDLDIAGLKALDYAYLQTSDKNSNLFNIDNIVLNVGYKTLAEVKAYYTDLLETKATALSQDANYSFSYDMFTTELASNKEDIADCENIAEVIEAYKNSSLLNPVTDEDLKALYVKILTDAKETLADSYVYNATAFNNIFDPKITAINNATTATEFNTAVEAANGYYVELSAIDSDAKVRVDRLLEYTTYYTNQSNAIKALNLDTDLESAAMIKLAAVTTKYVSTSEENPAATTFQGCVITNIDDLLTAAKGELDAVVAEYSLSVADLVAQYNDEITAAKTQAKDAVDDVPATYFVEEIDKISTLVATKYENTADGKAAAKTDYEATLSQIDAIVAEHDKKKAAVDGLEEYIAEQVATLLIDSDTYNNTYKSQMDDIVELCWLEIEDDKTDLDIAATIADSKSGVNSLIASIKAATEITVTFKKIDTDTEAYKVETIVKGGTVSAPENDPTLDNAVFAGWDFNFANTISDNKVIVAKWHDVLVKTNNVTSKVTFKGMSALPTVNQVAFGAKDKTVEYTVDGITYKSSNTSSANFSLETNGLKMNKAGQSVSFDVVAGSVVTIYLRNGKSDGTRAFDITSTSGLSLLNIIKGYKVPTGVTNVTVTNGTDCTGASDQNAIKLVITCDVAQTISIACAGTSPDTVHIQEISVAYEAEIKTEITGMTANLSYNGSKIIVSDVKLIPAGETDPTNYISITTGYNVSLIDELGQVAVNDDLDEGDEYTVIVEYGSYTVFKSSYTI